MLISDSYNICIFSCLGSNIRVMSAQTPDITSHFSENAFAMARLAGDRVEYDTAQLDHFRDTAQDLIGRTIPEVGSLAMVYRFAPRGGDIECDASFVRSKPGDALWIPEDQLSLQSNMELIKVNRATVEKQGRKGFEVNLKDFTQPLIMSVVESLCYPPPEDQTMLPGGGRFAKAWWKQAVEAFKGPDTSKIKQLETQAAKHFSGVIVLRSQTTE